MSSGPHFEGDSNDTYPHGRKAWQTAYNFIYKVWDESFAILLEFDVLQPQCQLLFRYGRINDPEFPCKKNPAELCDQYTSAGARIDGHTYNASNKGVSSLKLYVVRLAIRSRNE